MTDCTDAAPRDALRDAVDAAIADVGEKAHNTPEGNEVLARALSKRLIEYGIEMDPMKLLVDLMLGTLR